MRVEDAVLESSDAPLKGHMPVRAKPLAVVWMAQRDDRVLRDDHVLGEPVQFPRFGCGPVLARRQIEFPYTHARSCGHQAEPRLAFAQRLV